MIVILKCFSYGAMLMATEINDPETCACLMWWHHPHGENDKLCWKQTKTIVIQHSRNICFNKA